MRSLTRRAWHTAMSTPRFAAIIPVGPTDLDRRRAATAIESLLRWEPEVAWCVIADNAPDDRRRSEAWPSSRTCRTVVLPNRHQPRGRLWFGVVATGVLEGLAWIQRHTDAHFIVKIDTDALVIGPFSEQVRSRLARAADCALLGALGLSVNPAARQAQDLNDEPALLRAYRLLPPAHTGDRAAESALAPGIARIPVELRRLFDRVRPHVEAAVGRGYASNHYIQGGAYVASRLLVDRMTAAGYFATADVWAHFSFPEEPILAMYARALGLRLCDCSDAGDPFGVQYIGLPYGLEELVARGHSLIHSIKNDTRYTEAEIVRFFGHAAA